MGTAGIDEQPAGRQLGEPTLASTWETIAGVRLDDELLDWPPDVFALTNVVLDRAEAFRFTLSPVGGWPPEGVSDWSGEVVEAGRRWSAWVERRQVPFPELLSEQWSTVRDGSETSLEELARGGNRMLREALLTLHAVADEACAGLGVALDTSDGEACVYRARGRELMARTGSLARLNPRVLQVLPKVQTPPTGRTAFSRYACVHGPGIEARWNKMPVRHPGTDVRSEFANLLLLPWPLRVRASDFRPLYDSVRRPTKDPFSFFEYAPTEGLDFELLDRVLVAAREEVGAVDVVVLPESAVDEREVRELEALLRRHGVISLLAGIRRRSQLPESAPGNWLHIGVNPRLEKGATPSEDDAPWFHIRQDKHHRWSLDEGQIYQYHLGAVLHPSVRWWEAIDIPRRAIEFVEVAELTLVCLVCEDLAQHDDIAQLVQSVGPTVVLAFLLDGPQLTSRWSARYASVLADDPGSAVLTLSSFGMAQRSRPHRRDASAVVALWRDHVRGFREIPLEPGAQGVVLTICANRATRRSADGRRPVDNGTRVFDVAVHQVSASTSPALSQSAASKFETPGPHLLGVNELTILTGWAEAVAEALAHAPGRVQAVLADARPEAEWRPALGLDEPSRELGAAVEALESVVGSIPLSDGVRTSDLASALRPDLPDETDLHGLVRRVVAAMVEQRATRRPEEADRR